MVTKFRIPQEQMLGQMKMLWRVWIPEDPDPDQAQSDLEDLPVSHTKQLTDFFHFCAEAGDRALTRSGSDHYESSSDLEEIG